MRDTAPDIDAAFTALFAAKSPIERLRMTSDMFDAAKTLMAADIRARHPEISPVELRVQMFERLYFDDVDAEARAKIVAALRTDGPAPAPGAARVL